MAIYADTPSTDQSPAPPTGEDQVAGVTPTSPLGRALRARRGELIPAHSPQATGRVERLFQTVQARVSKERRLADVSTLAAANRFREDDLPISTPRVSVQPAQPADLHRPRPARREQDRSLGITTPRCLRRDWTVAHHGHLDQVQPNIRATPVPVAERVDGTMRRTHPGRPRDVPASTSRPVKAAAVKPVPRARQPVTPRPDHPGRTRLRPERTRHAAAAGT